jgi:hypothetical protein
VLGNLSFLILIGVFTARSPSAHGCHRVDFGPLKHPDEGYQDHMLSGSPDAAAPAA